MNSLAFDTINTSLIVWEVVSLLIVLSLALLAFSTLRRQGGKSGATKTLDRRYASGELTREEYLTIRDDITRNPDA